MTNTIEAKTETSQTKPSRLDKCLYRCLKTEQRVNFVKKWSPVGLRVFFTILVAVVVISSLVGLLTFKEEYVRFPSERDINGFEFVLRVASNTGYPPEVSSVIAIWREDGEYDFELIRTVECGKEDLDKFGHVLDEYYWINKPTHKLLCLDKGQHMRLKGNYLEPDSRTLYIQVDNCPTKECRDKMATSDAKDAGFIELYHKGTVFDPQDFNDPLRSYIGLETFSLTADEIGYFLMYIMPVEIISDVGLIGTLKNEVTGFSFDRKDVFTNHMGKSVAEGFLAINLSNRKQIYQRTYKKLETMLAELVGIASTLKLLYMAYQSWIEQKKKKSL